MRLAVLVIGATVGSWVPATAGASPWLRSLACEIDADARGPARVAAPLWDEDLRELRHLGQGRIIEGNEITHHVAFTFDDGPKFETTPMVLDALERYDVPATFFVVGWRFAKDNESSRQHAAILERIVRSGHLVGNHTYSHKNLAELTVKAMRREIDRNTAALARHLGYVPHAFRPPYGAVNNRARAHLESEGFTEVRWSIDTHDFRSDLQKSLRKRTVQRIIEAQGGVVLMHDTKKGTAQHIAGILDDLEAENCRRLSSGERLLVPVSLHYFMRNLDGSPRPIPPEVEARTQRYRERLPARCEARQSQPQPSRPRSSRRHLQ